MNILKKALAPITDKAWKEISEQADAIKENTLTHRKFVDINGPYGLDYGGLPTGRIKVPSNQKQEGVNYGIQEVIPLVEARKPFELDLWELDNIERGAKDVDLSALENATRELAIFEKTAVFSGFPEANIGGLLNSSQYDSVALPPEPDKMLQTIIDQITLMKKESVEGPYGLILQDKFWYNLVKVSKGYPVIKQLKEILGGPVIIDHHAEHSFLITTRGDDFELTLGQDTSLGYDGHDTNKVKLFLSQSFTFRVLSPEAVVVLNN